MTSGHDGPESAPQPPRIPENCTVLAFDFGEKRIGVAVGDTGVGIAHPLTVIAAEDNATRFAEIEKLVTEWRPGRFIVGFPIHADGSVHEIARLARRFARRLEGRFGIIAVLMDESYTSAVADIRLRETGAAPGRRRLAIDSVAAQTLLQAYFDSPSEAPRGA